MDQIVKFAKAIILDELGKEKIEVDGIMLFGSRARGDDTKYSDYDLLVMVNKKIPIRSKIALTTRLRRILAESLVDADIIIKSSEEVRQYGDQIGTVTREALREGVTV